MIYVARLSLSGRVKGFATSDWLDPEESEVEITVEEFEALQRATEVFCYVDGELVSTGQPLFPPERGMSWNDKSFRWEHSEESLANTHREKRDRLLADSDWTQLPDVPLETQTAWATYRQALRDVPQQPDFPTNVTWPEAPE